AIRFWSRQRGFCSDRVSRSQTRPADNPKMARATLTNAPWNCDPPNAAAFANGLRLRAPGTFREQICAGGTARSEGLGMTRSELNDAARERRIRAAGDGRRLGRKAESRRPPMRAQAQ